MITIPNWMFLSSFADLRKTLLKSLGISSLTHLGRGVWGSDFGSCAFTMVKRQESRPGVFLRLFDQPGEVNSNEVLSSRFLNRDDYPAYVCRPEDFSAIEGAPLAYWIPEALRNTFRSSSKLGSIGVGKHGMSTSDNARFIRLWHEVGSGNSSYSCRSRPEAVTSERKWFPFNKGGAGRRWYGNQDFVVNWFNDGDEIKKVTDEKYPYLNGNLGFVIGGEEYYFRDGLTWSSIGIASPSFRYLPEGFVICNKGQTFYTTDPEQSKLALAFLNSIASCYALQALSPTVGFELGYVLNLPMVFPAAFDAQAIDQTVMLARADWDNFETSWDFRDQPLVRPGLKGATLAASWQNWVAQSIAAVRRMQELETENNRLFISAYGLEDELTPEVPEDEITLARADARKDVAAFLSYAIGCMMGRYSLDQPGLILADAGDAVEQYLAKVGKPLDQLAFRPDEDGIVPVLEGEWFEDDLVARTREFLSATFGEDTLNENLRFIEESLGKPLEKYFLTDFYKDHLQTYKKRPIYWLFQSPKKGFGALVYLHRYTRDTVNTLLNRYLRDYLHKLDSRITHLVQVEATSTAPKDKTAARKERERLEKARKDCRDWERDVILPLAQKRLEIDLDDGVKVNYQKFEGAVAPIPGLAAKEE